MLINKNKKYKLESEINLKEMLPNFKWSTNNIKANREIDGKELISLINSLLDYEITYELCIENNEIHIIHYDKEELCSVHFKLKIKRLN